MRTGRTAGLGPGTGPGGRCTPGAAPGRRFGPALTRRAVLGLAATLVLPLGACGARSPDDPRPDPADGGRTEVTTPATTLRLGLTEWSIEASATLLAPGTVEVVVTNTGGTAHDVSITGEAGIWATPVLATGEQARLTVRTTPGEELSLVCTVAGHHAAGMHRTLRVAQAP